MKELNIYESFFQIPHYSQKVAKQCMLLWKAGGLFRFLLSE